MDVQGDHGEGNGTGEAPGALCQDPVETAVPEHRQIRRLPDSGRQVPLVTTDMHTPMERVTGVLFSRWAQERLFKYMCEEFSLDALPVHGLAEQDPEARVVNPARRELDRRINRMRNRLGTLRNRVADLTGGEPSDTAARSAERLKAEREALKLRRRELPTHVKVAELGEGEWLDALPSGERLLLDVIRMIACRAETRMMPAVADAQGARQRPRRPLAELFRSEADIVPDPENGILRVRILGTASDAGDAAIAGLLEELNQTRTVFPGAGLRLVCELPQVACRSGKEASRSLEEIEFDVRTSEIEEPDNAVARHADDFVAGPQQRRYTGDFLYDPRERLAQFGLNHHLDKAWLLEICRFARLSHGTRVQRKPATSSPRVPPSLQRFSPARRRHSRERFQERRGR